MDAAQIKAFIDAMAASDLHELEVSHEGWTLRLVRHGGGARSAQAAAPAADKPIPAPVRGDAVLPSTPASASGPLEVRAPMFGLVHLQQAPGEPPFVKVGDVIEAGQLLCTIEAMKVFNEVRSERGGRVAAVLVGSGAEVEAGQPLLMLDGVDHV
jgi:acetyl-CoA carboxylase biotin carboxyl carrier protein